MRRQFAKNICSAGCCVLRRDGQITNECELGAQCFSHCTKWSLSGCWRIFFLVFFSHLGRAFKRTKEAQIWRRSANLLFVFSQRRGNCWFPDPSRAKFVLKTLRRSLSNQQRWNIKPTFGVWWNLCLFETPGLWKLLTEPLARPKLVTFSFTAKASLVSVSLFRGSGKLVSLSNAWLLIFT